MTASNHLKLSNLIKSVHQRLRDDTKLFGEEEAWRNHCKQDLNGYAKAMQELAVNFWDKNSSKDKKVVSRIIWVYEECKTYFSKIDHYRQKEYFVYKSCCGNDPIQLPEFNESVKYNLLDVGSCYNPFSQFDIFNVIPIDIVPANTEVLTCDFLNVLVGEQIITKNQKIEQLQENYFHIVVFSLLLEYLPLPEQRLKCCIKAYQLLRPEGVLAVVTPDSNHVGSNCKIFKSWQCILAEHGFIRIKYEKLPHLHCMLFRKALMPLVAEKWATVHDTEKYYSKMFIPQDFNQIQIRSQEKQGRETEKDQWCEGTFLDGFFQESS